MGICARRPGATRNDKELSNLIGELSVVGELELAYEVLELAADSGLTIAVYAAEPGSRSQQSLDLLASWIATPSGQPVASDHDTASIPPPEV